MTTPPPSTPKIIHMTDQAVFIECENVPVQAQGQDDAKLAEQVSATICRPRCGYYKDSQIRKLQLYCFNPKSPHLAELKQKLEQAKQVAGKQPPT